MRKQKQIPTTTTARTNPRTYIDALKRYIYIYISQHAYIFIVRHNLCIRKRHNQLNTYLRMPHSESREDKYTKVLSEQNGVFPHNLVSFIFFFLIFINYFLLSFYNEALYILPLYWYDCGVELKYSYPYFVLSICT